MNRNPVKIRLLQGGVAVGTYVAEFYTAGLPGIIAATGADFVIFDYEHSGWATEALRMQIALTRGVGLVPLVNSPGDHYEREGLLLDLGAAGLMVPHVETAEQARTIVTATRYAPAGRRGGSFGIAHDGFRAGNVWETVTDANDSVLIIAKLESRRAIDNAEAILAVPGIDVALVSGFDLSLDMGLMGQLNHPDLAAAGRNVLAICQRLGKVAGCPAYDPETAQRRLAEGYRFIQYSWDIALLQEGLKAGVAAVRAADSAR
jgi:2-dehydro-3-deoxyglucarate aldolase/4-hydroxy-2-oxoheptanedioate aldolase